MQAKKLFGSERFLSDIHPQGFILLSPISLPLAGQVHPEFVRSTEKVQVAGTHPHPVKDRPSKARQTCSLPRYLVVIVLKNASASYKDSILQGCHNNEANECER
ncbi:hypothetical protein O6H91_13G013100 [Diphasiastrum complanatum]|uniref:Uncharacterized protein n=1 Tax=Diphasiastrum complanatum TaxID=34168 RepID=A0ACC2BSA3_DIPCM|nr:hypothetical protein O6H91_13G013100 [Diphasiastrum complanatum]